MNEALPWINTALIACGFIFTYLMGTRNRTSTSERELATMKLQVDTMWAAFLASGIVKGIAKGNLEMNSPVRLAGNSAAPFLNSSNSIRRLSIAAGIPWWASLE